ncbi:MAG: hypothetical protein WAS05_09115 [Candidatus Nanopelagicales bacterium]
MNAQGLNDTITIGLIVIFAAILIGTGATAKYVHLRRHHRCIHTNQKQHIQELAAKLSESRKENVQLMERAQTSFESGRASGLIDGRNEGYEAATESYEAEIAELQARYDRLHLNNIVDMTRRFTDQKRHPAGAVQ